MKVDQDSLRRKNEELAKALREKDRRHSQTQELYDKLRRRAGMGQVQEAALDAVNDTIQASVTANRFTDRVGNESQRPPPPLFPIQCSGNPQLYSSQDHVVTHSIAEAPTGVWAGFTSQASIQRKSTSVLLDPD